MQKVSLLNTVIYGVAMNNSLCYYPKYIATSNILAANFNRNRSKIENLSFANYN